MKNKKLKLVNMAAVVIFAGAFFLNAQSGFHEGNGLFGIAAIGQGTGTGSGSDSGSGSGIFQAFPLPCVCDTVVYAV